ncbi:MAG: secondary thiamine-phosphate synthase enzyme YjbQ [Halobacteriota archaeon]
MQVSVDTTSRTDVIDVTDRIEAAIPTDATGVCTVFVRHTTAGVVVNEAESRLLADLADAIDDLVPDDGWRHDDLDGNADSHVRAMFVGESVTVPITAGSLDVGRWQSLLLVECDGPRTRTIDIVIH